MHVYAHELYPLGYGLPMWDPQPFQKVVDVGDLGFVNQHGSFETLFNITVPAKQQKYSLPPGFQPFSLSRINTLSQSINKPYLSSGIQVVEDGPECSQINWVIRHGAILIIKDLPTKLFIHHSRPLLKYIEANQSDWYEFLENHKDCPVDVLDGSKLLLVTGIHRNSDWSLGAWTGAIAQRSLSYTRHTADTATIGWNPNPAPGTRDGPAPRTQLYGPLHDLPNKNLGMESLFLEGFRISRRDRRHQDLRTGIRVDASSTSQAGWWDWLLGSKGVHSSSNEPQGPTPPTTSLPPPPPPAGHSSANSGNNIQIVGDISLPRHPLDDFIDLLFSVLPNIQTTIVHDSDLLELKRISHKYGPNSNHLFDNLVQSGSCAFFGFSSLDFPLHDLGPIIADAAARLDIATAQSLTLTSKQLHRVCNPILYQSVHLSTSESLDRFIETISSSPDVA
ncbi:hypothetical protein DL96DRAFT_1276456 [Flagelloscypha sp. PMI_526]|nr:hypothetical protein DL96DRAFT_1276456 [Flagelloscypha sp. PMI_526]